MTAAGKRKCVAEGEKIHIHGLPGTLLGWGLLPVGFAVLGWAHQRLLYSELLCG